MYDSDTEFSILIVAYDRRDFILNAVNSALLQVFDRRKFEIIVIKNYTDPDIDNYLKDQKISSIYSKEIALGAKFVEGAKLAKGNYLCLLEDDDQFTPNKLSMVNKMAKEGAIYIHNSIFGTAGGRREMQIPEVITIDAGHFTLKLLWKFAYYNPSFNCSSITIDKSIILENEEVIKKLTYHLDSFLYLASLAHKSGKVIHMNEPMTIFRVHDDSLLKDYSYFIKKRRDRSISVLNEIENFRISLQDKIPKFLLTKDFLYIASTVKLYGKECKFKDLTLFDYASGLVPWPPIKVYLFKIKIIIISLLPESIRDRFLKNLYRSTREKYQNMSHR